MSGPETFQPQCLKVDAWPPEYQVAWYDAFAESDVFEQPKPAREWRTASIRKTQAGFGVYLSWTAFRGHLASETALAALVTQDHVRAYIDDLRSTHAPYTIFCRVQELYDATRIMAPGDDWGWLLNAVKKLRSTARPVRKKLQRLQTAIKIEELGLALMEEARSNLCLTMYKRALTHRDGLLIAFLIRRPLRLKNLHEMALGANVILRQDTARLAFAREEMKGKRPFEADFPPTLFEHLNTYLTVYRPYLLTLQSEGAPDTTRRLWISNEGRPMDDQSIRNAIKKRTRKAFGRDLTPHLFRDASVTSLIRDAPSSARLAKSILSHQTLEMTIKHYNQAQMVETSRRHAALIEQLATAT